MHLLDPAPEHAVTQLLVLATELAGASAGVLLDACDPPHVIAVHGPDDQIAGLREHGSARSWPVRSDRGEHGKLLLAADHDHAGQGDGVVERVLIAIAEIVRQQHALAERRERLEQVTDRLQLIVWAARPDGTLDYASRAFYDYIGRRQVDLAAGEWLEHVHPDDRDAVVEGLTRPVRVTGRLQVEFRLRRHDGQHRWHLGDGTALRDEHGEVQRWIGSAIDFHDQKMAQQRLAEQEQQLRAILDHEPECVKLVSAGGTLLDMNPAGLRMLDANDLEQVRGGRVLDLVHPDDREAFAALHRRVSSGRTSGTLQFRLVGLEGRVRWVESSSTSINAPEGGRPNVLSVTRDITALRRADAMRAAEATILHGLSSGAQLEDLLSLAVEALDEVASFFQRATSAILLADRRSGVLRLAAATGWPGEIERDDELTFAVGPHASTCGRAAHLRRTEVTDDIETDPGWAPLLDGARRHGVRSCWATPVLDGAGEVAAVLVQHRGQPGRPGEEDLDALERMARLLSVALDRLRLDEELRRTNALLTVGSRLSRLGGWTLEVADLRLTWSETVCDLHGVPHDFEPTVEQALAFYVPEHREVIASAVRACGEDGVPYTVELQIERADGERIWVRTSGEAVRDTSGTIVRLDGAIQDVTEQVRAAEELRQSEERFRLVARATSNLVWDLDLVADRAWRSDGMTELLGYAPDEIGLATEDWQAIIHPDDLPGVIAAMEHALASGADHWAEEYRVRRADGRWAHVSERCHVIRDESGRAVRLVGSTADVTAQREMEAQLEQSQRLEALGQLTGGIAHDFNNLLTVILGNAELLAAHLAEQPDAARMADMTRAAAERGAELTQRLLAFARRQPLDPKRVDIDHLLHDLGPLLQRTLGEDTLVQVQVEPDAWPALVDAAHLESAVLNLCINARDAMPRGGRVTLAAGNVVVDEVQPADLPAEVAPGEYVSVSVTDTGVGMSPDVLARAFDPFFTTKEVGKGSGLGLSMVYGFAHQSQGHVHIHSEPGVGTTVTLLVPRAGDDRTGGLVRPSTGVAPGGTETIVLVEDDDLVRAFVASSLRRLGYAVDEHADGQRALDALRRGSPCDLLLTDIVMPGGLNGREVAEAAVAARPGLRVLFTSGYAENALVHDGRLERDVHLLSKPYQHEDLARAVREALQAPPFDAQPPQSDRGLVT